jgi:hypothetical protein
VSELDEAWALALAEAEQRARSAGRGELAEYLSLRNSNDLLRKAGIDWLLSTFTLLAGEANRVGASLQIAHQDLHRFKTGNCTMVGTPSLYLMVSDSCLLKLGREPHVMVLFEVAAWPAQSYVTSDHVRK